MMQTLELSMNVVSNLTSPVSKYLSNHKTEIKLLILAYLVRYIHRKTPQIKETWRSTAPIRTIGRFAMNQYFQTPSSKELMQEQQVKYDNIYTKHYCRNATTIACKFSLKSIESLISNAFNPKMRNIRMQLQSLPKQGNIQMIKEKKYSLFKELFCIGVCRSICLIFMNALYHILLHIVFAMIARRNLYKNKVKKQQKNMTENEMELEYKNEMEDKRKLFEIINIFHKRVTEKYADILLDKMNDILIKHNDYQLSRIFDTIDDLKAMLFEDIINASLDAYNSLYLRSIIDIERILVDKKYKTITNNNEYVFCEMFYELHNITKCSDFNVLFVDIYREYIQFWLNDLLNDDILSGINIQINNDNNDKIRKKLRYLNIMNCIIANYDNLIKFKTDVENGKIDECKTYVFGDKSDNNNEENICKWDTQKICQFINQLNPMLANIFEKLEITGKELVKYDYYDILYITKLHEFYLPIQLWQNIAFQLGLPCVIDDKFIKHKYIQRKNVMMKQENILINIDKLSMKTKFIQLLKNINEMQQDINKVSKQILITNEQKLQFKSIQNENNMDNKYINNINNINELHLVKIDDMLINNQVNDIFHNDRNKFNEFDKFGIIFEKWAKYMLRLNEFNALKEFLNIISGFDLVSSKAEYFGDENTFDMLSNMMDMMGDFDNNDEKHENNVMEQNANPLFKAVNGIQNLDIKNSIKNKWNGFTAFLNGNNGEEENESVENGDNQQQVNNNEHKTFVSNLKSWWSESN